MVAITSESHETLFQTITHFFVSPPLDRHEFEHWDRFAQTLPRATFIVWLANEIVIDLLNHNPRHIKIDDMIITVDNEDDGSGNHLQHDAERFMKEQYSLFFDHTWRRRILVFRRLVKHKLRQSKY